MEPEVLPYKKSLIESSPNTGIFFKFTIIEAVFATSPVTVFTFPAVAFVSADDVGPAKLALPTIFPSPITISPALPLIFESNSIPSGLFAAETAVTL